MSKYRELEKPERIVVFEQIDVVPRRNPEFPNLHVRTTRMGPQENDKLLSSIQKSRKAVAKTVIKIREDLCPDGWFTNTKTRTDAKSALCSKLALQGFTVNPGVDKKYSIYVVKLKKTAWLKDDRQPIYVGESSYEPVERIAQHLEGERSARKVRNHFEKRWEALEPQGLILHSSYDAIAEETQWGLKLLKDGFKVFGPQGLPKD